MCTGTISGFMFLISCACVCVFLRGHTFMVFVRFYFRAFVKLTPLQNAGVECVSHFLLGL